MITFAFKGILRNRCNVLKETVICIAGYSAIATWTWAVSLKQMKLQRFTPNFHQLIEYTTLYTEGLQKQQCCGLYGTKPPVFYHWLIPLQFTAMWQHFSLRAFSTSSIVTHMFMFWKSLSLYIVTHIKLTKAKVEKIILSVINYLLI